MTAIESDDKGEVQDTRRACGSVRNSDTRKAISAPWTEEEDKKLGRLVERIGKKDWCMIASVMEGRTGRQCRERYCNYVDDRINRGVCLNPRHVFIDLSCLCKV